MKMLTILHPDKKTIWSAMCSSFKSAVMSLKVPDSDEEDERVRLVTLVESLDASVNKAFLCHSFRSTWPPLLSWVWHEEREETARSYKRSWPPAVTFHPQVISTEEASQHALLPKPQIFNHMFMEGQEAPEHWGFLSDMTVS